MGTNALRIALQIENFRPGRGGAEGYARSLAGGLVELGQEVTVICEEGGDSPEGVRLQLLRGPRHPKALRAYLYARRSERAAREGGFDIVHALGKSLGMNVLNPQGGVQAVWMRQARRSHGHVWRKAIWILSRYLSVRHHAIEAILRRQYRDPAVLCYIALSRSIADAMVTFHGVDREKIVVRSNRVDPSRFGPALDLKEKKELREQLGVPPDHLVFLFVGHNFQLKGLDPLLAALSRIRSEAPPSLLVVLGRGKEKRYRRVARKHGVEGLVRFAGSVTRTDRWYRAADACCHPTFYDTYSLVVLEALASGLPVLASAHDGASELITDGVEGVRVADPACVEEVAAGLRRLLDPDFRNRAGRAARERMTREEYRSPASEMLEIYRKALRTGVGTGCSERSSNVSPI